MNLTAKEKNKRIPLPHKICAITICTSMLTFAGCGAASGSEPPQAESGTVLFSEQADTEVIDTTADTEAQNKPEESSSDLTTRQISGDITDVGEGSFTVSVLIYNEPEPRNYENVLSEETQDSTTITLTVYYTQDTQFIINSVSSDGSSYSQSEGTAADLESGRMVFLDGIQEEETFAADKITIFRVKES